MAELRTRGYTGCFSGLARFVSGRRTHEQGAAPKSEQQAATEETRSLSVGHHVSSRVAAALLVKPRPLLTPAQAHKVDALKKSCPAFALMRSLAMRFRGILRSGTTKGLTKWLAEAKNYGIYSFKRFAKTLRRDWAAQTKLESEPDIGKLTAGNIGFRISSASRSSLKTRWSFTSG
jgi:transposase